MKEDWVGNHDHVGRIRRSLFFFFFFFQTMSELFKEKIKPNLLLAVCSKLVCLLFIIPCCANGRKLFSLEDTSYLSTK